MHLILLHPTPSSWQSAPYSCIYILHACCLHHLIILWLMPGTTALHVTCAITHNLSHCICMGIPRRMAILSHHTHHLLLSHFITCTFYTRSLFCHTLAAHTPHLLPAFWPLLLPVPSLPHYTPLHLTPLCARCAVGCLLARSSHSRCPSLSPLLHWEAMTRNISGTGDNGGTGDGTCVFGRGRCLLRAIVVTSMASSHQHKPQHHAFWRSRGHRLALHSSLRTIKEGGRRCLYRSCAWSPQRATRAVWAKRHSLPW